MARAGASTSTSRTPKSTDVDAYIAAAPKAARPHLRELRQVIRAAAPKATERISYGIVGYFYPTRLIFFGVHKDHIGLYPAGEAQGLDQYLAPKSTLRFPLDQRLPVAKISSLVKRRVRERDRAAAGKAAARSSRKL
ncbi:MAG TPA: DUF1801 domain-containing protein [Candidatus Dormibacteraeota bacterium]|nr:DUF1801 domain-containing protein [Candidatus Dormibacteraeota bacterium]